MLFNKAQKDLKNALLNKNAIDFTFPCLNEARTNKKEMVLKLLNLKQCSSASKSQCS